MNPQTFQLQPFPGSIAPPIQITGSVTRDRQGLHLIYMITGAIETLQLPLPQAHPARQLGLWETTCLECFVGRPGDANYWEFNFAPNGNWQAFALSGYREGLQAATEISTLSIQTDRSPARFSLSVTLPWASIAPPAQPLEMSVTAVIQILDGDLSYWAIAHCGRTADFHCRDSFQLAIAELGD